MSAQLALRGVTKVYAQRVLLDQVSFTVRPGEHVGIVGENGAGKSTLLRIIAGQERPNQGEVTVMADGGVGYLEQTLDLPPHATVQSAIDNALAELRALERELRSLEARLGNADEHL